MNRREFITLLGGATAWPLAARAQQSAMPVIGFLNSASPKPYAPAVAAFHQGLKEIGYLEGQNVAVEYRWAAGQYDRVPAMALELVGRGVAVIVANTPGVLAIKAAITTIPIVFTTGGDPVQLGLVTSLSRPGGNVTGLTILSAELLPKRLEMARDLVPTASLMGALVNPTNPQAESHLTGLRAAARTLTLELHILQASSERDLDSVFASLAQLRAGALVIDNDTFFVSRTEHLAALTVRYAVPTIFLNRAFAASGGLMSYGGSLADMYRQAGIYTGRILKGEKPADLPVQQVTKIELIINLKTAKTLGLDVPTSLLLRADEVIE
jgi:putative tryptophan/tyrosine transport system substrate-binding protein